MDRRPGGVELSIVGRVVGESVSKILFRSRHGAELSVGDLLVAEGDRDPDRRFLLRVVDLRYGADSERPDWMPRTAGEILHREERGESLLLEDAPRRLYVLGVAVILGVLRGGRFRKSKTIPPHFSRVRRAEARDYEFLREFTGDIEVGYLRSGESVVPVPVGVDGARSFPHHVGIFATTGMGKSNLMKVLASSALEAGKYGVLIFDPHGEYYDGGAGSHARGLSHHPLASRRLLVFSSRPLRGPHSRIRVSAHEIELGDLKHLYEFTGPQAEFLDWARGRYGAGWMVSIQERTDEELSQDSRDRFHPSTIGVVKRRIERLFRNDLVHRDENVTMTGPVLEALRKGRVVLVDTAGLGDAEELLVASILSRAVLEAGKREFEKEGFDRVAPILITLEEAQRVLGKQASRSNVFAQIAREGRKFKVGICAITQQPKLLDPEVLSQLNTLFILGLADSRDREILQESAKQDVAALDNEIQTLMPGEALVTTPYAPFAIPALVHLFEEHLERKMKEIPPEEPQPPLDPGFFG